jgi:ribosomal protein S18 acetylase RimI-like enzyme
MRTAVAPRLVEATIIRPATGGDLEALVALEQHAFATDRISRRGFRRLVGSGSAAVLVAEIDGCLAGYALVLFRTGNAIARLYSIAAARGFAGRGVGASLLAAAETAGLARGASRLRLEVRETNAPALALYHKAGYRLFGRRPRYYQDGAPALRFEKRLAPSLAALRAPPPYFHQTSEFTCGPACMMMALAWADPSFRPDQGLEFKLWREATTIFTTSGPGGCEPFGVAVTLKRHGLATEIHASHAGPYFLDTVRSDDKRRIMRLAQEEFRREAAALSIPIHLAPLDESGLMEALGKGAVAIVLVSGYRMVRRNVPHWIFVFGCEGRHVLAHDPAARRDANGNALEPETYAIPPNEFDRMTRFGRNDLRAAILIRKGPHQ